MAKAYVDPWDMLNKFYFHANAANSLTIGEIGKSLFLAGNQLYEWYTHIFTYATNSDFWA